MMVIRKPLIDAPTTSGKVTQLIKELYRIIDDLNVALQEIDKEIRGDTSGDEK